MLHNNLPMVVGVCMYHNVMDNRRMRLDFIMIICDIFVYMCSDDFLYKLNVLFHKAECRKQVQL